jgi:hypothetical protein
VSFSTIEVVGGGGLRKRRAPLGGGDRTLFLLCDGLCVGGLKNISKNYENMSIQCIGLSTRLQN